MKFISPTILLLLLLCESLFGQAATPATPPQTFHVKGTITDPLEALIPWTKVSFLNEQLTTTVNTNSRGVYEADLPVGSYTMTATAKGFRTYRRPLFRVVSREDVIIDVRLPVGKIIDVVEIPATPQESKAALKAAANATTVTLPMYGEELFRVPSADGTAYELYIRYTSGHRTNDTHDYSGDRGSYDDPVFVAYNLFSLHADHVTYDVRSRTLEASSNVVAVDESGVSRRGESMRFKIESGQAIQLQ